MTPEVDFVGISHSIKIVFYVLTVIAVLIFIGGIWKKVSIWSSGEDEPGVLAGAGPLKLLWLIVASSFARDSITAHRVFPRNVIRGVILLFIILSFLALFLGTVVRAFNSYIYEFITDSIWQVFSLVLDLAGLLLLAGLLFAIIRRYILRPKKLRNTKADNLFLLLLFLIVVSGFIVEGGRLAFAATASDSWSFVGYIVANAMLGLAGSNIELITALQPSFWMIHAVFALVFIAYIPYSKAMHMFATQIITYVAQERQKSLDMETA